ncbi:MAG TPA: NAD-glutamate dehydrogenase, partial [bacterium]|nr:NAD-glutamate dehydrogenase [bacterium]
GLLTAAAIDAAAGIVLTELGLPPYFFRNLSREALSTLLRSTGRTIQPAGTGYVLRSEVSEVPLNMEGGLQLRIATPANRDRMEAVLDAVMSGHRIEYYRGREGRYFTYIIHSEPVPSLEEVNRGCSPFAFNLIKTGPAIPAETRSRYETFLQRASSCVYPLVEVTQADTGEVRLMFLEDFRHSPLPVIRRMLEELKITLNRAYWETYRGPAGRVQSVCSLYLKGQPPAGKLGMALKRLKALLAIQVDGFDELYTSAALSFPEYLFLRLAAVFLHTFVHKQYPVDREIMAALDRADLQENFARRVFNANRSEFTRSGIVETLRSHPELVKELYRLFDRKFNPEKTRHLSSESVERTLAAYRRKVEIIFVEDRTACDLFLFLTHLVTSVRKTNFYRSEKRAFSFWLDPDVLDPTVFSGRVYSVFLVVGFHGVGTHMRAAEIARGGLRLSRVTAANYENILDEMPLLNFALGPVAQRLKHKDIAEDGAKGVIVPAPEYAAEPREVILDYGEGILDLVEKNGEVLDYLGKQELVFFGPDEGTAGFMDLIAGRARDRGYRHWRTVATGKSTGIPHDAYGLTEDGKLFGLHSRGEEGTELEIEGRSVLLTRDTGRILHQLGWPIETSGMTTTGVLACLRTIEEYTGLKEEDLSLMMTGGPDGDLGSNQLLSFRGKVCLIVDSGAVLFDAHGLDREELAKLALARHTRPRLNCLTFPESKLSRLGFKIPRQKGSFSLPDKTMIEDGAFFHRSCLTDISLRRLVEQAGINVFIPCGGFKDTINSDNVTAFLSLFKELRIIVEGANVFFDETSRDLIARRTSILQIRDLTANKGGVTSSSLAEVLPGFLLGDEYEKFLVEDAAIRSAFIREILQIIRENGRAETKMLLLLHEKTGLSLPALSVQTSRWLLDLQDHLYSKLEILLSDREMVAGVLHAYIPGVLRRLLGPERLQKVLSADELVPYRNAIITKKLASLALYRYATEWPDFLKRLEHNFLPVLRSLLLE